MAAVAFYLPYNIVVRPTNVGAPSALFYFYAAGTTTLRAVYADAGLTTQLSNPVIADGAGRIPAIYLDDTLDYRLQVYDKDGAQLIDRDPYLPGVVPDAEILQPYVDNAETAATAAAASETAAATSATSAATSATNAFNSSVSALGSASDASESVFAAAASATAAATSETAAAADASNASSTKDAIQALIDGYPGSAGQTIPVATRAAAKAISAPTGSFYLYEDKREGDWVVGSYATISSALGSDPQEGVWFQSTADATKAFVRKPAGKRITPYHFGAAGGYSTIAAALAGTDDTVPIKALLTFWKNNPTYVPDFLGQYWTVSSEITIQQTSSANESAGQVLYGGIFVTATGSSGTRILTINARGIHIKGQIGAIGCGDASGNCVTYANRSWDYGIYLVDSTGIRIDSWYAANVKCWGFDTATEDFANLGTRTNGNGSNIGVRVGPGNAFNCGSAAGQANASCLTYAFDSVTFNGTTGSATQTCTVHFTTALDTKIAVGDAFAYTEQTSYAGSATTSGSATVTVASVVGMETGMLIAGTGIPANTTIATIISATSITISAAATATNASVTLTTQKRTAYTIKTIDLVANTLEFYFWLPVATTSGTMDSAHGGFLHVHGNSAGESSFGPVEGIRCGVGVKDSGLYGSYLGSIHTEASGINLVLGTPPNGVSYGGTVEGQHTESGYLLGLYRSISPNGRKIGPASANGVGDLPTDDGYFDQWYHSRPRYSSNFLGWVGSSGLIMSDGLGGVLQNEAGPNQFDNAFSAITISNRPHERFCRAAYSSNNTPTVTLKWHSAYADLWTGKNWMGFELFGAQSGRNALSQVTVQLDAGLIASGWTLNGATAALVYTPLGGPCRGIAVVDVKNKNFKFTLEIIEPQELRGTATNGDAAATLNAGTSKRVQIWNTPLTAARAVSLSTTNAKDGDSFKIVRTAAATGASSLNVGTGPLKALAVGQWAEVTYSGAAWLLTALGSL